jgi:hypothetical protein
MTSAFDTLPRTAVRLNALSRHHWGPDPQRTVRLAVLDTPEGLVARVIGAEADRAVVLEEAPAVEINRRTVTLADGRRWDVVAVAGCTCKIPGPLKGLDPRKV